MKNDYLTHICSDPAEVDGLQWDQLLSAQQEATPFMQFAYLSALHASHSACPESGWTPFYVTVHSGQALVAATVVYIKPHSYGEYVFDWAWANAYQQHGVPYYPKAVVAVPFTPVPGARLLAKDTAARTQLMRSLIALCEQNELSSLHLLFTSDADQKAASAVGMMLRHTVQFHWNNHKDGYPDFDAFLQSLSQEKRKKIRQERRKVQEAGVQFRHRRGAEITAEEWDFFYACYARTYREHGNPPYLTRDFFSRMASTMPDNWLLFVAERNGQPIASSLIGLGVQEQPATGQAAATAIQVAYGRYWGALERVDCLHFEACYYQPLAWCIANGFQRFEGGAQGEHKMARALMPTQTTSAHWIAHPEFSKAVRHFLEREDAGIAEYVQDLEARTPFRSNAAER